MHKNSNIVLLSIFLVMVSGMVDTSRGSSYDDLAIKQSIQNEAGTTSGLRAEKVKIAVEKGYVVLYGTVDKYIQKMDYEKIAWKTSGVIEVDNEIRVTPVNSLTDTAIERKIKEIVKTYRQFQFTAVSVSVKSGAADVLISVNHPADILFLKRKIAEIDGVISIDIMANFVAMMSPPSRPNDAAPLPAQTEHSSVRPAYQHKTAPLPYRH